MDGFCRQKSKGEIHASMTGLSAVQNMMHALTRGAAAPESVVRAAGAAPESVTLVVAPEFVTLLVAPESVTLAAGTVLFSGSTRIAPTAWLLVSAAIASAAAGLLEAAIAATCAAPLLSPAACACTLNKVSDVCEIRHLSQHWQDSACQMLAIYSTWTWSTDIIKLAAGITLLCFACNAIRMHPPLPACACVA